ncbi:hypothetical protein Tco_0570124 [Tanacetum coccineum]
MDLGRCVQLLGELGAQWRAEVAPVIDEAVIDPIAEMEEQKGGTSTAAAQGHTLAFPAHGFPVPSLMIEDLSTRIGNLEYGHGQLVKKVIKADVPLLGELGSEVDEPMVALVIDKAAEPIAKMEEQVIALVIDMEEDLAMLFGDDDDFSDDDFEGFEGGPSTAAAEGHTLALPAPGFPVPLSMIEYLSTLIGNLEYGHGQLIKKVIKVSDT